MTHTELISEVITQVSSRFKADVPLIKKRIEDLLNREFLERVDNAQVPTYNYLA
jgi:cullin 3